MLVHETYRRRSRAAAARAAHARPVDAARVVVGEKVLDVPYKIQFNVSRKLLSGDLGDRVLDGE